MTDMPSTLPPELLDLIAKEQIRYKMACYGRGVDRCDRALLDTVFWPDSTATCGYGFSGTGPGIADWAVAGLSQLDQTMHMLGQMLIEVKGNNANVETYTQAYHRVPREGAAPFDIVIGLRYIDRFEQRSGEWRIASRIMMHDWFRTYEDSCDWEQGFFGQGLLSNQNMGGRFPDDPSYIFFRDGTIFPTA